MIKAVRLLRALAAFANTQQLRIVLNERMALASAGGAKEPSPGAEALGRRGVRFSSPGGRDTLSHSYAQNHIHLVFSTKNRQKLIPKNLQPRLWSYTAAICKNHDILAFAVGGMDDHIHLLFRLPPTLTLARAVTLVKSNSSK